jgi:diguanylate cyclase (GGDEF)-like protein
MLDRLAARTLFWGTLTTLAGAIGLLSVGASAPLLRHLIEWGSAASGLFGGRFTLGAAAPWLSLGSLAIAVSSWRRLHRELARAPSLPDSVRQLHEAMQANVDGIVLLRAIREVSGTIRDFEILDVNPSGAALVRMPQSALVGKRLRRDLPALSSDATIAAYARAMESGAAFVDEVRVNRRHVAAGWLLHHVVPTADGVAITLRDMTAQKRHALQLQRVSITDDLTRLYNRRGFLMLAEQQLRIARRQEKDAVLLYVDMDAFKALNDQHGHAEGDRALVAVARLLRMAMRDSDVVGRMGGDEFTIMALDADRFAARSIQRRIEERVALLNASGDLATPVSLTIGHTRVRPTDHAPVTELLARADTLLYERKRRRKLTASSQAAIAARPASAPRSARGAAARTRVSTLAIPPDVAAMARAATRAAASRVLTAPNGTPYTPTRMA